MNERAPAFYAFGAGSWRDLVTLLHAPYTLLHLSFVVLGAAFAQVVHLDRLLATLTAFFLAVGVASHFLDELRGRPMRTQLPSAVLLGGGLVALGSACLIGVGGLLVVSHVLLIFIAVGAFIVVAYNLELAGGAFHNDHSFAIFWGAFPFLTAYWVMDESFGWPAVPGAAACLGIAYAQRALSTEARMLRRRISDVRGQMTFHDGSTQPITRPALLEAPERALRALCLAIPLLAAAALLSRDIDL